MSKQSTARTPAIAVTASIATTTSEIALNHGQLTLTFADGTASALATIDLSPEILSQALIHGLKQKLVDAAAIARNTDTGASATLEDKKSAVLKVLERLIAGQWNAIREGGTSEKGSLLLLALTRLQPNRDRAELEAWVKGLDDAQRSALSSNPKILPTIQAIQAERAAARGAQAQSDELLAGLGL